MARATSVAAVAGMQALLPDARVLDAYRLVVDETALDARMAAQRVFARVPAWIGVLMAVRNILVAPLGLRTTLAGRSRTIGFFPVLSETPQRVLLGLDDRHLDFRIAVDVMPVGSTQCEVTATTLVRTHGLLGRIYLGAVLPFHRVIVPAMLAQAAHRRDGSGAPASRQPFREPDEPRGDT
jgi:hypothetical protein